MVEQEKDFEIKQYHHEQRDAPFFAILAATTVLHVADIVGIIFLKGMLPAQKQITQTMGNEHCSAMHNGSVTVNVTFEGQ